MSARRAYAANTKVPVDRSKVELERLLVRHGAAQYGTAHMEEAAIVFFTIAKRHIRLQIPLPGAELRGDRREQVIRSRWRSMLLICKAKLEIVEMKLSTIEREFLADITLPDGTSVGEWLRPGIEKAYLGGAMPRMLGMGPSNVQIHDATLEEETEP